MSKNRCGKCKANPARGFATINGIRYCHDGASPTCYERVWYEDMGFGTREEWEGILSDGSQTPGDRGSE